MRTDASRPAPPSALDDAAASNLTALIMGAYVEMPGLQLNQRQMARMFSCPESACGVALNALVIDGRLRKLTTGVYAKA